MDIHTLIGLVESAQAAREHGYDAQIVCRDADDMLKLEQGADE